MDKPSYVVVKSASEAKPNQLNMVFSANDPIDIQFGKESAEGGKEAMSALRVMVQEANENKLDAIVTGPLNKSTIDIKGFNGHTAFLAQVFGSTNYIMMMVSDELKMGLVTDHLPLKQVAENLSTEKIIAAIKIMNSALKTDFGIVKPKIAVLGLNPHAGDNGLLGDEEKVIIKPAVDAMYQEGIFCFGPYSADGFFGMHTFNQFDGVLAMYHDQGLIPFKYMSFADGVNYTAGLKTVRTSPDHGTAYDIAGKGIADPQSFINAIYTAITISKQRKETADLKENPLNFSELRRERFRLEL
jgi:4-hydroxythreonine-4-phosphate dehydrogenase